MSKIFNEKKWEVREDPKMQKVKENYQKCDAGSRSNHLKNMLFIAIKKVQKSLKNVFWQIFAQKKYGKSGYVQKRKK